MKRIQSYKISPKLGKRDDFPLMSLQHMHESQHGFVCAPTKNSTKHTQLLVLVVVQWKRLACLF
jgi:hypothetical protein